MERKISRNEMQGQEVGKMRVKRKTSEHAIGIQATAKTSECKDWMKSETWSEQKGE